MGLFVSNSPFLSPLGNSVHELKDLNSAEGGQGYGKVVQHLVLGTSTPMNSESIVDFECFLPLLDLEVAWVHLASGY